jgi:hypothetical protein
MDPGQKGSLRGPWREPHTAARTLDARRTPRVAVRMAGWICEPVEHDGNVEGGRQSADPVALSVKSPSPEPGLRTPSYRLYAVT